MIMMELTKWSWKCPNNASSCSFFQPETVRQRLTQYESLTKPLIEFYELVVWSLLIWDKCRGFVLCLTNHENLRKSCWQRANARNAVTFVFFLTRRCLWIHITSCKRCPSLILVPCSFSCRKKGLLKSFSGTETNVIWPKVKDYLSENFFKKWISVTILTDIFKNLQWYRNLF